MSQQRHPGGHEVERRTRPLVDDIQRFLRSLGHNMYEITSVREGVTRSGWGVSGGWYEDEYHVHVWYEVRKALRPHEVEHRRRAVAFLLPRLRQRYGTSRVETHQSSDGVSIFVSVV